MDVPNWVMSVGIFFLGIVFSVFAYFLKDIRAGVKEKQSELGSEINKIRDDVADLRERLPKEYVLRDDFIRTMATMEKKMDDLLRIVMQLNKKLGGEKGDERERE